MPHMCPKSGGLLVAMGDGEQIADGARPHALLLVMIPLVAVVALALPTPIHRRDALFADQMLLDRSRRVEEHRLGAEVDPQHIVWLAILGGVAARRGGVGGRPSGRLAVHGSGTSLQCPVWLPPAPRTRRPCRGGLLLVNAIQALSSQL